jgi:hypothetical protein
MERMNNDDIWTERLSEYVDGELPREDEARLEAHLPSCAECRDIVEELRAVAARAASLPDAPPTHDLWPGIAADISRAAGGGRVLSMTPRRFSFTLPQLVAASLALMVLSGGMVWMARLGGDRTDIPAVGARTSPVAPAGAPGLALPVILAEAHYDDAIADLQQTLDEGRTKLDPETVAVLERNLVAIDRAIEQCREALSRDPANAYLSEHLVAAKKRKLALLRRAAAMAESL